MCIRDRVIAGGALILKSPNVLPWNVTPETGAVFGWMFIGAAAYFAYAVVRPSWHNAGGQLAGFLIYDVVLIVPFLQRLSTNGPTVNLVIYLAVVIYSGVLAAYFLFVNSTTRLIAPRPVSVSYTHLDVYKRQPSLRASRPCPAP